MFKQSSAKPSVKVPEHFMPQLLISPQAYIDLESIVLSAGTDEIGWLGEVEKWTGEADKHISYLYLLHRVFVPEQTVHASETEITENGLVKLTEQLLEEDNGMEAIGRIRLWGHSHVNMGATPSGQDKQQWATLMKDCEDFFFMMIANKKGDMYVSFIDLQSGVEVEHCPWKIDIQWPEPSHDWEKVIKEVAKTSVVVPYQQDELWSGYGNYGRRGAWQNNNAARPVNEAYSSAKLNGNLNSIYNGRSEYTCTYSGLRNTAKRVLNLIDMNPHAVLSKEIHTSAGLSYMPSISARNYGDDPVLYPGWRVNQGGHKNFNKNRAAIDRLVTDFALAIHKMKRHDEYPTLIGLGEIYEKYSAMKYADYIRATHPIFEIITDKVSNIDEYLQKEALEESNPRGTIKTEDGITIMAITDEEIRECENHVAQGLCMKMDNWEYFYPIEYAEKIGLQ